MNNQLIITKDTLFDREYMITAFLSSNRLVEVNCNRCGSESVLGNVYIGKVKKIVKNINAAFVEIYQGQMGYLPLINVKEPLMAKQSRKELISEGDELVVQVAKEAIKTKEPMLSTNISLTGKYMVFTSENKKFGISKKLDDIKREQLKEMFGEFANDRFGVIIRTNAGNDSKDNIFVEFQSLYTVMNHILDSYRHRTCYSLLYEAPMEYVKTLKGFADDTVDRIQTDDIAVYRQLENEFKDTSSKDKICLYEDDKITLSSLYGLKYKILDALKEKVWLKSGAYIIIEPTEALTVIDVNSGKNIKGKNKDYFLQVNLEAAEEIALQLRLRNISGICVVDFINLDTPQAKERLLEEFRRLLHKDTVPAELIDMTKLGLVEITRKKIKKSLREQIAEND